MWYGCHQWAVATRTCSGANWYVLSSNLLTYCIIFLYFLTSNELEGPTSAPPPVACYTHSYARQSVMWGGLTDLAF